MQPYHLAAFTGASILNPAVTLENAPVVDTDMDERFALLRVLNDFVARPDMNPPNISYRQACPRLTWSTCRRTSTKAAGLT